MPRGRWWQRGPFVVRRLGLVRAAIAFGVTVAVLSEGLGAFDAFARLPLVAAWLIVALAAAVVCARARPDERAADPSAAPPPARDPIVTASVVLAAAIIVTCLVAALFSAPSNSDVLSYHMPRVRHWLENRSFAHYPANSIRQLSFPPGAGYFVAQLQLLSGGDRFASLPQWSALVGCVFVTGSLAGRLFGNRSVVPTALACATVPMAVLQATQPQTDLLAAFWLLCFVWLVFERRHHRPADVVWLGAALGLGLVTKPTVLVFVPPFLAILALRAARSGRRRFVLVPAAVVVLAALPVLPHNVRNHRTFGDLNGPSLGITLTRHDPRALASNVLRHVVLNYPSVTLWQAVAWVHTHVLHIDVNDAATTHPRVHARAVYEPQFAGEYLMPDENMVGNPLHVSIALVGAATALLALRRRRGWATARVQFPLALALSFVAYCAVIRWQPWANRLLLPLVVLATPLVGWTLAKVTAPVRATLVGTLALFALIFCLTSVRRPFFALPRSPSLSIFGQTRGEQYFAEYELHGLGDEVRRHYDALLRDVEADRCSRIALVSEEHDPEYLLWVTLDRAAQPVQLRAEDVTNRSRSAAARMSAWSPCGRVAMSRQGWGRYTSLR
jgi:4-amino-4-deoxy-L-arabinose transferase-like glycosyltransferase